MSDTSVKLSLDVLPPGGTRNKRHKEGDLNESVWLFHGWTEDGILNIDKKPPKSAVLKYHISQGVQHEM